jgi:hypothetical protein
MTAVLRDHARARAMSRSTRWRVLDAADLKPQRCVYGLTSHDPGFDAKAHDLCALSGNALHFFQQGRLLICVDEKTGMQRLQRQHPTQPAHPGKPATRAQADIRHGVRGVIASCVVPTGQVLWHLGPTRTSEDFAAPRANVRQQRPAMARDDWVVDNLKTPWRLDVCRLVAAWCALPCVPKARHRGVPRRAVLSAPAHTHVFHCTPKQGSWLHPVEVWVSVLARRFWQRGDVWSPEDCATRLVDSLDVYTTPHAHPYRWTDTGQPLGRATPFSQTRRPQRQGRAWCSPRSQCVERAFYPPRP